MQQAILILFRSAMAVILSFPPVTLYAATDANVPMLAGATPLGGSEILSVGINTLVVIGAIVIVGWMYSRAKYSGNSANNLINVVSSRPLGAKERLLLVEVGDKQLLIGMTSAQVQTLHVFDEPIYTKEPPTESTGFAERLRTAIRGADK